MTDECGNNGDLTEEQGASLRIEIDSFFDWLELNQIPLVGRGRYETKLFRSAEREDWVMWVQDPLSNEVHFNTYLINECSFDYFKTVILHECFHLFAHNLANKADAKRLRDDFGDQSMALLDIEADFFVAEYLRHVRNYSLVQVFRYFHEGSSVFGDPKTRILKLERFVGSILSIAFAQFTRSPAGTRTLFLPTVQNILTDSRLHVLTLDQHCFTSREIDATVSEFVQLNRCYTMARDQTAFEYISYLIAFAASAMRLSVPTGIDAELSSIRTP